MQKIRASTQIFDDNHLLLTTEDIRRIWMAVLSDPNSDEHLVYNLQRGEDGGWKLDWEGDVGVKAEDAYDPDEWGGTGGNAFNP